MGHNNLSGMDVDVQSKTTTKTKDSDVVFFENVPL
jgi:hypothetical protein